MKRFDKKGMLVIPNPQELNPMYKEEHLLLVEKCFCPNGHNLINDHSGKDLLFQSTQGTY